MLEPRPDFVYEGTHVKPQRSHKYLGIYFDQELRWDVQAENAIAKAAKWTLLFRRLTKPSTGIHTTFMCCLYRAIAVPKYTYAADVWFTPLHRKEGQKRTTGSVNVVRKLTSIQRIATTAITGAMRTTATDTLEAHADIQPIELTLLETCHRAVLRLASLPKSHPLHKPISTCARRMVKRHASPLHNLLHTFGIKLDAYETIVPALLPPNKTNTFMTEIAEQGTSLK